MSEQQTIADLTAALANATDYAATKDQQVTILVLGLTEAKRAIMRHLGHDPADVKRIDDAIAKARELT